MIEFPPTIILRHRRENLKKCSLTGLSEKQRPDFLFFTYPKDPLPDLSGYLMLKVGAPPLSPDDGARGLFAIDGTWRLAEKMERSLTQTLSTRSLPGSFRTAYPRRQTDCPNPEQGLSTLEAIYLAYRALGRDSEGLLDHYYWKDLFLEYNQCVLATTP